MSITYGSGPGTVVTSSAKNGTVKSFTGGKVRLQDPITTGNNGNLETSPTYVGRLIYIDGGTGSGQTRFISGQTTGQGDGDDVDLDVSEAWETDPDGTSTYQISYIMEDAETLGGYTYVARTGFYEEKNILTVGSGGGTFAFLYIASDIKVEMNDNSSTTQGSWTVENGGRLDIGYDLGGVSVDGGFMSGLNAVAGELQLDCKTGSITKFHDGLIVGAKVNNSVELDGGTHTWSNFKMNQMSYQMLLNGVTADGFTVAGAGTTNDTVRVEDNCTINSIVMSSTYGFESLDDGLTETLTVRDCVFVNTAGRDVRIHDDKTWNFVNPVNIGSDSTAISFETDDLNEVNVKFSLDILVTTPQGIAISEAQCYVYEGLLNQDLPTANRVDTDSSGEASTDVLVTKYTYPSSVFTTVTSGDHALKIYKWLKQPFVTTLSPNFSVTGGLNVAVSVLEDTAISEQDQATAISDGSGIVPSNETQPGTLIAFTLGSGAPTLSVGDTVTGASSSASGVVVEFTEGDATAGKIFLETRNSTDFTDGETLNRSGGGWSATHTSGSSLDFSWWIDCNSKSGQATYNFLAAKMASDTPDAIYYTAIQWGEEQQTQLIYSGQSGYETERSLVETLQTDDCDATTGWSAGTDSAVALNSSEFQQGSGALNLSKTGTTGTTCSMSKTTTSVTFASFVGCWVYILDTTTLDKLTTTNAIEIRFGNDGSNYYYQRWDKADLAVGWNFLNFKSEGASTTGSPSTSACDYTEIIYNVTSSATTTTAGDVIVDDFKIFDPQGVFLANRGSGTVSYMTADDGSQYVPPASVTVEVTVKDKSGVAIQNAGVYVQLSSGPFDDDSHIVRAFTNASGIASGPYTYTGDVAVTIHVRKQSAGDTRYQEFDGSGTIGASGLTSLVTLEVSTIQE